MLISTCELPLRTMKYPRAIHHHTLVQISCCLSSLILCGTTVCSVFSLSLYNNHTNCYVLGLSIADSNLGYIDSKLLLSLLPLADLSGAGSLAYIDSDFSSMSPTGFRDAILFDDATLAKQQVQPSY